MSHLTLFWGVKDSRNHLLLQAVERDFPTIFSWTLRFGADDLVFSLSISQDVAAVCGIVLSPELRNSAWRRRSPHFLFIHPAWFV